MVEQDYDVIIIGAGIGGLICGNFLAQGGKRALICERHCKPGGYLHGFKRREFYFYGGCQSFSSNGILFPLLKKLNLYDRIEFIPVDYRLVTPNVDVKINSIEAVSNAFKAAFPQEAARVENFFQELAQLVAIIKTLMAEGRNPLLETGWAKTKTMLSWLPNLGALRKMGKYQKMLGIDIVNKHFTNEDLRTFFSQLGYRNMSALCLGGMWASWLHDYWYPMGGMQAFSNLLADNFIEHGGDMRFRTAVNQIIVQNGKARGIVTETGEEIYAPYVVSAGDYKQTFTQLIDSKHLDTAWLERVKTAPVSETFVTVYLGTDYFTEEMRSFVKTHHVLYSPTYAPISLDDINNAHFYENSSLSITVPSLRDTSLAPAGKSSVILQAPAMYDWLNKWQTGKGNARTQAYRKLKEKVADQLIATAEDIIPRLSKHISVIDIATPLTHERFTMNSGGASAGWSWDPRLSFIQKSGGEFTTPIRNLYAAGHWTLSPGGVPPAALSGKVVADIIAHKIR